MLAQPPSGKADEPKVTQAGSRTGAALQLVEARPIIGSVGFQR